MQGPIAFVTMISLSTCNSEKRSVTVGRKREFPLEDFKRWEKENGVEEMNLVGYGLMWVVNLQKCQVIW